jgi:hypothetical protein
VGMGNTLGPGETGRRCMVISRGASTRGLTGVQCGKRRGPQCGVCAPANICEEPKIDLNLFSSNNHEQTYEPRVANLTALLITSLP